MTVLVTWALVALLWFCIIWRNQGRAYSLTAQNFLFCAIWPLIVLSVLLSWAIDKLYEWTR